MPFVKQQNSYTTKLLFCTKFVHKQVVRVIKLLYENTWQLPSVCHHHPDGEKHLNLSSSGNTTQLNLYLLVERPTRTTHALPSTVTDIYVAVTTIRIHEQTPKNIPENIGVIPEDESETSAYIPRPT